MQHIPDHVHPKDFRWWMRLVPYLSLSAILLLACFGIRSAWFMYLVGGYAVFRLFIFVRGGLRCMHCLVRAGLAGIMAGLLYLDLPFQYLLAGLLLVWADYFLRFGHGFISETKEDVEKLKRQQPGQSP